MFLSRKREFIQGYKKEVGIKCRFTLPQIEILNENEFELVPPEKGDRSDRKSRRGRSRGRNRISKVSENFLLEINKKIVSMEGANPREEGAIEKEERWIEIIQKMTLNYQRVVKKKSNKT